MCYQLFPDTDNSKNWHNDNYILYPISKSAKIFYNILKLNTQLEPGYSVFYIFSKIFAFTLLILLILILFIVYKIVNRAIIKNKLKPKINLKKKK